MLPVVGFCEGARWTATCCASRWQPGRSCMAAHCCTAGAVEANGVRSVERWLQREPWSPPPPHRVHSCSNKAMADAGCRASSHVVSQLHVTRTVTKRTDVRRAITEVYSRSIAAADRHVHLRHGHGQRRQPGRGKGGARRGLKPGQGTTRAACQDHQCQSHQQEQEPRASGYIWARRRRGSPWPGCCCTPRSPARSVAPTRWRRSTTCAARAPHYPQ